MAILTISREFGSGGEDIGRAVAQSLGYEYVDRQRILNEVKALGTKLESLEKDFGDEHYPNFWERYDWSFKAFVAVTQSLILNYALKDKVVFIGRGGNFLLQGIPFSFRIRVVAPIAKRIEGVMHREDISQDIARLIVKKADTEMSRAIHFVYGKNWDDPAEYDTIFDMGIQTPDEVISKIKQALSEKDKLDTEGARQNLRLRATAAKVKAGIATNPALLIPTFDVVTVGDSLVLQGIIHNPKEKEQIEGEARKLAGDIPLKCELHYRGLIRG